MSEEDKQMFDKLKRKRAANKSKLTIFAKFIENLDKAYPNKIIGDSAIYYELEQRMERFAQVLDDFNGLQAEIDELEFVDIDAEAAGRELFEREFFALLGKGKQFLSETEESASTRSGSGSGSVKSGGSTRPVVRLGATATLPDASQIPRVSETLPNRVFSEVKLPEMNLNVFDGDLETWPEFRDTFEALINNRASLSDIEKFHYLRSYIARSVYETIGSLDYTSENYRFAWEAICKRYNNATDLTQHHLEKLFAMEKLESATAVGIRRILDSVTNRLKALKTIGEPTEHWDTFVVFLMLSKLDDETCVRWQEVKLRYTRPTLAEFSEFLDRRSKLLVSIERNRTASAAVNLKPNSKNSESRNKHENTNKVRSLFATGGDSGATCAYCKNSHSINDCSEFLRLSIRERLAQVKQRGLCINCLKTGHLMRQCRSRSCRTCRSRHHTLLHIEKTQAAENAAVGMTAGNVETVTTLSSSSSKFGHALLSTVSVRVCDKNGRNRNARALLDTGSQSSFITSELCELLELETVGINITVSGISQVRSQITRRASLTVQSRLSGFSLNTDCLVIPKITGDLPSVQLDTATFNIPENIRLADPDFGVPGKIDMLIGADYFWQITCVGQIRIGPSGPILQKTRFGWIVAGHFPSLGTDREFYCHLSRHGDLDRQLERFWTIEEVPSATKSFSREEELAESHFINTTGRDADGRFVVTIPLRDSVQLLGDSREIALKRFLNLERKLSKNPTLSESYHKFIREYREMGHMVKVTRPEIAEHAYCMPHHGVIRESSTSTKLRVVFDASCSTTSGYSFNDIQLVGPTIQNDLFSILLLFRKHAYVVAGDVEKMYRMCKVDPSQWPLQRILWRDNSNSPIDTYELTTVTYGTSSAPFLAIRCLYELGLKSENEAVSEVIKNHFYVDDMLTGGATVEETVELIDEVVAATLESSGFYLRKFVSNSTEILQRIKSTDGNRVVNLGANENAKTLGVIWNAAADQFSYKICIGEATRVTKRSILSETSQIFDPLGFLCPTIIVAKILMRNIWLEKIGWDESLPTDLHTQWLKFRSGLRHLNEVVVPRRFICSGWVALEIHGFSDASMSAYGACIYLVSRDSSGETFSSLICAKSRVSPVKVQTIPRLELLAAALMCKLMGRVRAILNLDIVGVFCWTDSTIVLGWLKAPINILQTFVANRVSAILEISSVEEWRHVPSGDNPADCVSRGVSPEMLKDHELYWNGPRWLRSSKSCWPEGPGIVASLPEIRRTIVACACAEEIDVLSEIFKKYSDLSKIRRIVAYCIRFKTNSLRIRAERNLGPLLASELAEANLGLVRFSQALHFPKEISLLTSGRPLEKNSKLLKLNPHVDQNGILRVGGRLVHSDLSNARKHPMVLDCKDKFTKLLFLFEHERLLHAGPQLLLSHIRLEYWPVNGRNLARKVARECVACFRAKPSNLVPMMGNLPSTRVTPAPPFFVSGVDYAGPFRIKDRQGRGCKVSKAYVSVFVCFTTHAVHFELVPSLSTESFIAAFRRFIARRGKPSRVYSDNGTNFVGAYNELRDLGIFLQSSENTFVETFENEGISWSFIPAGAPHFGGLWEAGVKSMKHHLTRVAGNALLTFEQFYTLIVQVEAILNSRPMYPLSSDPSDLLPITPSHFIIGRPLTSIADPNLLNIPENRLNHYERIQQLKQHIWNRWSLEYLSTLQERSKWRSNGHTLNVGDLIVVKEENLPPLRWLMGRVISLHPGRDGVTRVATVRTRNGVLRRPLTKLCLLPKGDLEEC